MLHIVVQFTTMKHSCQPSRFWRDSPDILTSVPPSPDLSRLFLERCTSYCAMLDYVRNSNMSVVTTLNLVKSCFPTARVHGALTQSYVNHCTLRSLLVLLKEWLTGTGRDHSKVGVASKILAHVDTVPTSLSQRLATMMKCL